MPMEGMSYEQLGFDPNKRKVMLKRLQDVALPIGLKFSDKRNFVSNTIMAHLLTEYAETHGGIAKQNEVADRLLKAFFGDAAVLDEEFLVNIASDVGFDKQNVSHYLTSPENQKKLKEKARGWSDKGLNGVPFFFMNGKPTFSGAQETDVFKSTILKIAEKFPLQSESEEGEEKKSSL